MKIVLQRVSEASVTVDGEVVGQIGKGFLVLLGVQATDTEETADRMVDKMCRLRIFEDENGKTNLSLADVGGELLVVSQFTLYADCRKGNRPSFIKAGPPEMADRLMTDQKLREDVIYNQSVRLKDFEHGTIKDQFEKYIKTFIGE